MDKFYLEAIYKKGHSMAEIAKMNNVSLNKIAYWMRKYGIATRNRSEATYVKKNPNGDPFLIADLNSSENQELLALGIALYLGEGSKTNHGVRISNSNPKIINLFLRFLNQVCGVKIGKVRAWINIFDDRIYQQSLKYWVKETGIPSNQFYSPTIRKRKSGNYKNKSLYGTITISVDNQRLKHQIITWCEECLLKYAEVAQW